MKDYGTLVNDIVREERELTDKINKLEYFVMTEDFQNISERQQRLLIKQHDAMKNYKGYLIARVVRIRQEHKENEGKENEGKEKACDTETDERLEPHVFAAMEYETHRQKEKEIINCAKCKHYKQDTCTHRVLGWRQKLLGDKSCWESKE